MICVFFVPGMFGTTVEYVLRAFTNELDNIEAEILPDGSMHSFKTQMHLTNRDDFVSFFTDRAPLVTVTTPIYPLKDTKLPELLSICQPSLTINDRRIFVYADSAEYAELNMLFQYHKISASKALQLELDIFCGDNASDIVKWNPLYTHWSQMKTWELREWFSFFYPGWTQEWIDASKQVDSLWTKVSTRDLLNDTEQTFKKIIQISGLSRNHKSLTKFANDWRQRQQYVLDEHKLINHAVECIITQVDFSWSDLNIIAEAMIQNKLREAGFEILCDGLNKFPTNAIEFHKLLMGKNNNA